MYLSDLGSGYTPGDVYRYASKYDLRTLNLQTAVSYIVFVFVLFLFFEVW